jgi:hypothetical protein
MSSLRTIRSFTVEMLKIAADIKDADIQKLLTERQGKEYLEGGRLQTNTFDEAPPLIKMSLSGGYRAPVGMAASDNYNLKSHKKKDNAYQKARDYATTGVKGALTGLGVLGASNAMRGRFGSPSGGLEVLRATRQARRAATIGGSAAMLDRAYRYDELSKDKEAMVSANPNDQFRSPASALAESSRTGRFESKVIHDYGKPPKTFIIGKKFRIP